MNEVGTITKIAKNNYAVQFPKGVNHFKTKKVAEQWQALLTHQPIPHITKEEE